MEYTKILKRAFEMVWRYRALWLFGALLALTTVNGFFVGYDLDRDEFRNDITVTLPNGSTIYLPGEGLTIDLSDPGGLSVRIDEQEWRELRELFTDVIPPGVWAIAIAAGIVLLGVILVGAVARYVAEAALIRMVNETEETGEKLSLRRGLRLGFSRTAWRLFLIDLLVYGLRGLCLLAVLAVALSPLLLWTTRSAPAGIAGTVVTVGLFFLWVLLIIVVGVVLSPLMQVIRRACAVEGLGAVASIRRGVATVREHLKEVTVVWLIWISTRLLWMFAAVPVMIVISPVMLLSIALGAALGGVPAAAVGGVLSLLLDGPFPWIVGGVVGLPIFIVVTIAPMLFLGGLVEVFKSNTWTLTYRELRALESTEMARVPAPDRSGLEVAPAT